MAGLLAILPGTGRWQHGALTEGGFHKLHRLPNTPSPTLRMVPLPVPGRIGV